MRRLITVTLILAAIFLIVFAPIAKADLILFAVDQASNIDYTDYHYVSGHTGHVTQTTLKADGDSAYLFNGEILENLGDTFTFNRFNSSFQSGTSFSFGFWLYVNQMISNSTPYRTVPYFRIGNSSKFLSLTIDALLDGGGNQILNFFTISLRSSETADFQYRNCSTKAWYWVDIVYTQSTSTAVLYMNSTQATYPNNPITAPVPTTAWYVFLTHATGAAIYCMGSIIVDFLRLSDTREYPPTSYSESESGSGTPTTDTGVDLTLLPVKISMLLGIPVVASGILATLVCMCFVIIPTLVLGGKDNLLLLLAEIILVVSFGTVMTWLPYWILILVVFAEALVFAWLAKNMITGEKGA